MAVVTRLDVEHPTLLALRPATQGYADMSGLELIPEISTASVEEGLLAGEYEGGLTYSSLATDNPECFRVANPIGTADDAWIVWPGTGDERASGFLRATALRRSSSTLQGASTGFVSR